MKYLIFMFVLLSSCATPKKEFTQPINGGVSLTDWESMEDRQAREIREKAIRKQAFKDKYGMK